jgi:DNA-directed RNA polymerase II subunit RPB1
MALPSFNSDVNKVLYYPLSEENIRKYSPGYITLTKQINNEGKPEPHGTYDASMGTISPSYECNSCGLNVSNCPGHTGYTELNYPIEYIIYAGDKVKFVRIICIHCFRIIMDPTLPIYPSRTVKSTVEILNYILTNKIKSDKVIYCDYCNDIKTQLAEGVKANKATVRYVQPKYVVKEKLIKIKSSYDGKKYITNKSVHENLNTLYNDDVLELFEKLPDSELIKHGIDIRAHPRHYLSRVLTILPPNLRFINNDNKKSYLNQLTLSYSKMIDANENIGHKPKKDSQEYGVYVDKCYKLVNCHMEYIKAAGDSSDETIYSKLKSKQGEIRKNLLGKNISKLCRVVIVCNTAVPIDTIIIPREFAKGITIQEVVTPFNKAKLERFIKNRGNYPGFSEVYKAKTKVRRSSHGASQIFLEPGDIVHRHLVDGDTMVWHRCPTVSPSCLLAMKIIVNTNANASVGMNVLSCDFANADFDGDQMNGYLIGNEGIRFEVSRIMSCESTYLGGKYSAGNNTPFLGLVQDSVLAFYLMTHHDVVFSRFQTINMLRDVPITSELRKLEYTGREIMSMVMPRINYEAPSPVMKDKVAARFRKLDESDKYIKIVKGQILSGIVCGSAVKGGTGSIYHKIYCVYGAEVAHTTMFRHQQIGKRFLEIYGYSIGYKDLVLTAESRKMSEIIQTSVLASCNELNNRIINKSIQPPLGVSTAKHITDTYLAIHNNSKADYYGPLCKSDSELQGLRNSFFLGADSGAKGKLENRLEISTPLGQRTIDGTVMKKIFEPHRSSIWHQKFSLDPAAQGYVSNSYTQGMTLSQMNDTSRVARNNVLTKGLVVGEAGVEGRNMIGEFGSALIDNRNFVSRDNGYKIISFICADDGFEPSTLVSTNISKLFQSDSAIRSEFAGKSASSAKFIDGMLELKHIYLHFCIAMENTDYAYNCAKSVQVPFSIEGLIEMFIDADGSEVSASDFARNLALVQEFINNCHYIRVNPVHRAKQTRLLNTTYDSMTIIRLVLYYYLNPVFLSKVEYKFLEVLLAEIAVRIRLATYAPGKNIGSAIGQTMTAPLTQYLIDAHHASVTGGTSRDGLNYVKATTTLKDSKKISSKGIYMYVYLKPKYEQDEANAVALSNYITTRKFSTFLKKLEILSEKYGDFSTYPGDKEAIMKNEKISSIDIAKFEPRATIFRYCLNAKTMASKSIKITDIMSKIESRYEGFIYTMSAKIGEDIVLYMLFNRYFDFEYTKKKSKGKEKIGVPIWTRIENFANSLSDNLIINEFDGIESTLVVSRNLTTIGEDGAVSTRKIYYVRTFGIDIENVLLLNVVDKYRTSTSHIVEVYNYEGMIAARNKYVSEIASVTTTLGLAHNNLNFPADIMFELGYPANLSETGQKCREGTDVATLCASKNPINILAGASVNITTNNIISPNSNLIMGQVPNIGTRFNNVIFNKEFIKEHTKDVNDEDLLNGL